ncbi:peptidase [Streptomyces sp. ERV7]|uniref:LysR family transcriptional regulator n=1 Tax=Streptomyces sp. ERV7 TaxID=1322334 RepID=UPI0007F4C313|nr:LysR family transcriptional regulator [Streptomyces sp. ERV7]OAR26799.1 peptidase [Streptomyces sp. ERV7]
MQLELRHLQAVCQIAEAGSLGRAARRLGVSQPSLSAQLRRIERVTGGDLFIRTRHGTEPTPLGRFVLARARRVLSEMDALGTRARTVATDAPLRLGCILLVLLDGLLDQTDRALAGQEITLDLEHSVTALTRMLGAGRYDAIVYGEVNDHEVPLPEGVLARTLIPEEPFSIRMSARHPLAHREHIELADLAAESWMTLVEDDDGGPEAFAEACARAGFAPRLRHRITDRTMQYALIARGAVALSQPTGPRAEGTVMRPLVGAPLTGRIRLAWNRSTVPARQAELLYRAALRAYLANVDNNAFHRAWWDTHPELHPQCERQELQASEA